MFYKIKFNFRLLYTKFLNWRNGNGFTLPEPDAKTRCQYRYFKAIAEGQDEEYFEAYEKDLRDIIEKSPPEYRDRKDVAKTFCEVFEDLYGDVF